MEEKLSYSKILDIIKGKAVDESRYLGNEYRGFITTDFTDELMFQILICLKRSSE